MQFGSVRVSGGRAGRCGAPGLASAGNPPHQTPARQPAVPFTRPPAPAPPSPPPQGLPAWPATGPGVPDPKAGGPGDKPRRGLVRILSAYAREEEEVELFKDALDGLPKEYLEWHDALEAVRARAGAGAGGARAASRGRRARRRAARGAHGWRAPPACAGAAAPRDPCTATNPSSPAAHPLTHRRPLCPLWPPPAPAQFPEGLLPGAEFELRGRAWRVLARKSPASGRTVHLAVPADGDADGAGAPAPRTPGRLAAHPLRDSEPAFDQAARGRGGVPAAAAPAPSGKRAAGDASAPAPAGDAPAGRAGRLVDSPIDAHGRAPAGARAVVPRYVSPASSSTSGGGGRGGGGGSGSADDDSDAEDITPGLLVTRVGPGALRVAPGRAPRGSFSSDSGASSTGSSSGAGYGPPAPRRAEAAAAAAARRKYVRDVVAATNPAADNLSRYKALIALIEHCKARARGLGAGPSTDWGREPAASVLHAVVDVGEALAGFGNAQFPERSGEARAVLAADYKALLSEYLTHLGGALAPGACRGLSPDTEAEVRAVGGLLATRCAAYKVLYEQLVARVGGEGGGGGAGAGGPPCLIFNTNNNALAASPVTHNTNKTCADARAEAVQKGIGAAALAAVAFGAALLLRVVLKGGGGGSRARDGTRLPRGRNAREMALVSALSACGDELRKAERNDSALHNDWRLGRHVRFAWPPTPEPPGYQPLSAQVCDITGVLQDIYGH
jgi:hypothetical protein